MLPQVGGHVPGARRLGALRARLDWGHLRFGITLACLALHNRLSVRRVAGGEGPVVSLTSHGDRVRTVHLAIESIGRGTLRPHRLILWLDDPRVVQTLPESLRRLVRRGLEVRLAENLGPHTKYFPTLWLEGIQDKALVTADDDVILPEDWLQKLDEAHRADATLVQGFRAHVIQLADAQILPYTQWLPCRSMEPSYRVFLTGVSGVIYPPPMLEALRQAGKGFLAVCPRADDIWLHAVAVRNGFRIRQIVPEPLHFRTIPNTQGQALMRDNLVLGRNDVQIRATYDEALVQRILTDS